MELYWLGLIPGAVVMAVIIRMAVKHDDRDAQRILSYLILGSAVFGLAWFIFGITGGGR